MNEANLLRTLRQYRKVRSADFHQPVTRDSKGKIEDDRGVVKVRDAVLWNCKWRL